MYAKTGMVVTIPVPVLPDYLPYDGLWAGSKPNRMHSGCYPGGNTQTAVGSAGRHLLHPAGVRNRNTI
jgi:hypothetical protein